MNFRSSKNGGPAAGGNPAQIIENSHVFQVIPRNFAYFSLYLDISFQIFLPLLCHSNYGQFRRNNCSVLIVEAESTFCQKCRFLVQFLQIDFRGILILIFLLKLHPKTFQVHQYQHSTMPFSCKILTFADLQILQLSSIDFTKSSKKTIFYVYDEIDTHKDLQILMKKRCSPCIFRIRNTNRMKCIMYVIIV